MRKDIVRYLNPWMFQRDKKRRRFEELRRRHGDNCWRCRRPMRFDLPSGHDQAPTIEHLQPKSKGGASSKGGALDNLCLCHVRCNQMTVDSTREVQERMRLRAEEAVAPKRRVAGRRA
jgi:5-methylcytosine-specific restriction endonuclease McrA